MVYSPGVGAIGKTGGQAIRNLRFWKKKERKHRMNEEIMHNQLRLISEDGKQLGVVSSREALKLAQEQGLDLIEIAPHATPPVCKIMDYGKFRYEEKKKSAHAKKKQAVMLLKEIKFRPKTDVHDVNFKVNHVLRFLAQGHRVRLTVFFRGRELAFKEKGFELLDKVMGLLGEAAKPEGTPQFEGRQLVLQVVPGAKAKKLVTKPTSKTPKKGAGDESKGQASTPRTEKDPQNPAEDDIKGASQAQEGSLHA